MINRRIKTYIEFINESTETVNNKLDLSNYDSTIEWIKANAPEQLFDEETGELDYTYTDSTTGDDLETLIDTYREKYNDVKTINTIDIYRMLKLNSIDDLDLKHVGVFWSFNLDGIGAYGLGKKFSGTEAFTLIAEISTKDIDWEQGFYSFLAYGSTEFECYVKKGSECLITHINNDKLTTPLKGIC